MQDSKERHHGHLARFSYGRYPNGFRPPVPLSAPARPSLARHKLTCTNDFAGHPAGRPAAGAQAGLRGRAPAYPGRSRKARLPDGTGRRRGAGPRSARCADAHMRAGTRRLAQVDTARSHKPHALDQGSGAQLQAAVKTGTDPACPREPARDLWLGKRN